MRASLLVCVLGLLALDVVVAVALTEQGAVGAASRKMGLRGESGDSGESGASGSDEAEDEKENANADLLNAVKEKAALHREAQEELAQALHGSTKMTQEAKAVAMKRGSTADSTDSALINSLSANEAAIKALEKSKAAHKELVEAKLKAGIALGSGSKRGKIGAVICRKRLKKREKEAMKLAKKAHVQQAKAWAADNFMKAKVAKAHRLAKDAAESKNRDSMDETLQRSRKATQDAQQAREDALKAKQAFIGLQAKADDLREEASRIADECAFLLAESQIGAISWKGPAESKSPPPTDGGEAEPAGPPPGSKNINRGVDKQMQAAQAKIARDKPAGVVTAPAATPSESVQQEAQRMLSQDDENTLVQGAKASESNTEAVEDVAQRAETDAGQGKKAL